jgi:hypothetical protein
VEDEAQSFGGIAPFVVHDHTTICVARAQLHVLATDECETRRTASVRAGAVSVRQSGCRSRARRKRYQYSRPGKRPATARDLSSQCSQTRRTSFRDDSMELRVVRDLDCEAQRRAVADRRASRPENYAVRCRVARRNALRVIFPTLLPRRSRTARRARRPGEGYAKGSGGCDRLASRDRS